MTADFLIRPIHPFPARMAPGIAMDALGENEASLRVLDPMAGSGTVLAVARAKGHYAFGVDLDPLAVLLAGVWTKTVDAKQIFDKAEEVLSRARKIFSSLTSGKAYPYGSDEETRRFVRYWFDDYARRQLASLSLAISRVRDGSVRDVLWCGFSRLIITKQAGASLAMDLSHSRPHKTFSRAPTKPFDKFLDAIKVVVGNCTKKDEDNIKPQAAVQLGDARKLPIEDESIDLVLTSPPYLNAIDYMRCSKFSLIWMGYNLAQLRKIRSGSVGTEASLEEALDDQGVKAIIKSLRLKPMLAKHDHAILARYVWDMGWALKEASRVLRVNGRAVYVVGDSTIRGTFIRNSAIITSVAERSGLHLISRYSRVLPENRRYLPPPRNGTANAPMNSRMRREVVLMFDKK